MNVHENKDINVKKSDKVQWKAQSQTMQYNLQDKEINGIDDSDDLHYISQYNEVATSVQTYRQVTLTDVTIQWQAIITTQLPWQLGMPLLCNLLNYMTMSSILNV